MSRRGGIFVPTPGVRPKHLTMGGRYFYGSAGLLFYILLLRIGNLRFGEMAVLLFILRHSLLPCLLCELPYKAFALRDLEVYTGLVRLVVIKLVILAGKDGI